MKKIIILVLGLSLAISLFPQDPVKIKENISFWYVYMEMTEPRIETPEKIRIFLQEIRKQGLESKISGSLFCILFDSPLQVEGVRDFWGLAFNISEDTAAQLPLKKAKYCYGRVATTIHKGFYEVAGQAYNIILPFIEGKNLEVIGQEKNN